MVNKGSAFQCLSSRRDAGWCQHFGGPPVSPHFLSFFGPYCVTINLGSSYMQGVFPSAWNCLSSKKLILILMFGYHEIFFEAILCDSCTQHTKYQVWTLFKSGDSVPGPLLGCQKLKTLSIIVGSQIGDFDLMKYHFQPTDSFFHVINCCILVYVINIVSLTVKGINNGTSNVWRIKIMINTKYVNLLALDFIRVQRLMFSTHLMMKEWKNRKWEKAEVWEREEGWFMHVWRWLSFCDCVYM